MSLVRLLFDPREHRRRSRLYRMYGTYKNYPPQHALLNVGFMTILRRTSCFILIWTCSAVLTEPRNYHFQIVPASKQNPNKNKNAVCLAAMLCLENDTCEAAWQVSPSSQRRENGLPHGSQTLRVSRDKIFKGSLTRSQSQRPQCQRFSKVSKSQGFRVRGDPGSIVRFKVLGGHPKQMVPKFLIQGFRAQRVKGFQDRWGYIFNTSPGHKGNHMQSICAHLCTAVHMPVPSDYRTARCALAFFFFFEIQGNLSYQRMLLYSAPVYPRVLAISRPI